MAKRKRRAFTPEFKAEAVRLCRVGDRTVRQVASDLDLTETALREWVKRAEVHPGKGPLRALKTIKREELRELPKRVKRLEMEREKLKKPRPSSPRKRVIFELLHTEKAPFPSGASSTVWKCPPTGSPRGKTPPEQEVRSQTFLPGKIREPQSHPPKLGKSAVLRGLKKALPGPKTN